MIWRDLYMLLAIAGFTACMALFNAMYSKSDSGPEPREGVGWHPPSESVHHFDQALGP